MFVVFLFSEENGKFMMQIRRIGQKKRAVLEDIAPIGQNGGCQPSVNREIVLYKPYFILHFYPVMTPQFAL